ncbi:MAG: flavodoxin [Sphaerochaetaceae bacterium]|nr:flavodoxin [Sphaerochaetaceae bacterium]
MNTVAIVYQSLTGNTQAMAEAIMDGVKEAGAEVSLIPVAEANVAQVLEFDVLVLGCPAMGDEVLEEADFEPFFTALEPSLNGRKLALFGSYGWGDGAWMRDWSARCVSDGAVLYDDQGLICQELPDAAALVACQELGKGVAVF